MVESKSEIFIHQKFQFLMKVSSAQILSCGVGSFAAGKTSGRELGFHDKEISLQNVFWDGAYLLAKFKTSKNLNK